MIFGYVLVETLVFYAVAKWLGVGTALLLLLGVFFGGMFGGGVADVAVGSVGAASGVVGAGFVESAW